METDKGHILLYQTPDGEARIEVRLQGETVWLSLDQIGGGNYFDVVKSQGRCLKTSLPLTTIVNGVGV